ncbi:gamma-glutamylcyclotransferase [Coleofasciculus sp. FACHB-1120]|uniref:gamma-glutamylcyclotransferase family protein n=1 Tax=Coleofasciculus sp. FACHB-1120 TaxID=2692783 RepID=UPI0016868EB3|nr:gamma-glutamylcyclotransferase [Coleofasciculus sp. FACHB-1120]MBD2741446.1 gamma-glutamylcyclotransferase [Coleofasciculus sp. FACHB-1120]
MSNLQVFVYGTLKPGECNYERYCAGKVVEEERAIAFGELFSLPAGYPAMIPGSAEIHGFLLTFPDSTVLQTLDNLEGYDPHRPEAQNEYNRHQIETYNLSGQPLAMAWTYLMTPAQVRHQKGVLLTSGWWSRLKNNE